MIADLDDIFNKDKNMHRAFSYAFSTSDASAFACLENHCLVFIAVGTESYSAFAVYRYFEQNVHRTCLYTDSASCALVRVDMRETVFSHGKGAELADIHAVSEADASPLAHLCTVNRLVGSRTVFYAAVNAARYAVVAASSAGKNGNLIHRVD